MLSKFEVIPPKIIYFKYSFMATAKVMHRVELLLLTRSAATCMSLQKINTLESCVLLSSTLLCLPFFDVNKENAFQTCLECGYTCNLL